MKLSRRRFLRALLPSLLLFTTYSYLETNNLQITKLKLGLGLKIAFLVDTHLHSIGKIEERVIDTVNKENPDVILHGGDIIDEYTGSLKLVEEYFSALESKEKYAVLGNHDYWCHRTDELVRILKKLGFKILRDEVIKTSFGTLYGVDWRDSRIYQVVGNANFVLAHDPNVADYISEQCFILAGHTHGGVVIGGMIVLSNSHYTRGLYKLENGSVLYVSRGLGQIIPLRPTSPLELVFLE